MQQDYSEMIHVVFRFSEWRPCHLQTLTGISRHAESVPSKLLVMLIVITRLTQRRHINQDNSTQFIAQHALVCVLSEILCTWECVATQCWGNGIGKVKSIPLQSLAGPEGSRRLRLPFFKTLDTWRWLGYQPYTLSDRYAFLLDPRALEWPGGLSKLKKFTMTPWESNPLPSDL
jgi:hypothetical protein